MIKMKLFYDKDAEEVWLNELSSQGWEFQKFFLGFYRFRACEPGEFRYQIDLLDNWNGEKEQYASFMEDVGVEVVGQWWRWVYLKKRSADGPFELYTDAESKRLQYKKIKEFFIVFAIIELICFGMELAATIATQLLIYGVFTVLLAVIAIAMLRIVWKCNWKMKQLEEHG